MKVKVKIEYVVESYSQEMAVQEAREALEFGEVPEEVNETVVTAEEIV